jgi:5-methylcytosine-specific restriction endonuclease McrA
MALSNQALGSKKWKDIRLRVLARDGYVCTYCGTHLEGGNATVDHITSRKVGGDIWDMDNLTSACKPCNSRKGSRFFNRVSTDRKSVV